MQHWDPVALECLAAIVETGGFEKAAQRLHVTQSAVSQRLRALEEQAGSVLVVRSRPLRPTRAGQLLLKHAQQLRLLRADLARDMQTLAPHTAGSGAGVGLAVAVNADSIATWALEALTPLVRAGIALEVITDDQDFTQEWLRSGEVLGCVTTLRQPLQGCRVQPLGAMRYLAVAAPEYAAAHLSQGLNAHNFHRVPFLCFNRKDDMQSEFVARLLGLSQVVLNSLYLPNSEAQVRAVEAGWGVGVLPELLVRDRLSHGRLVDVAPGTMLSIDLYWHCWNLDSSLLRQLTDTLLQGAKVNLKDNCSER
ncbi:LysR family transcriptional regulator ArgP [Comamonas terrigena]|uniref:LysR family transcriptional regulator ArgP n=1 Tax=Comamonas terrigena TaxID=32013 RepID=UPI0028AE71FE|nr:LysR family transcriptional regulator ArgP [Comamonas terrigena]